MKGGGGVGWRGGGAWCGLHRRATKLRSLTSKAAMFFFKRRKPGMFLKMNMQVMATHMPNRGQRRRGGGGLVDGGGSWVSCVFVRV